MNWIIYFGMNWNVVVVIICWWEMVILCWIILWRVWCCMLSKGSIDVFCLYWKIVKKCCLWVLCNSENGEMLKFNWCEFEYFGVCVVWRKGKSWLVSCKIVLKNKVGNCCVYRLCCFECVVFKVVDVMLNVGWCMKRFFVWLKRGDMYFCVWKCVVGWEVICIMLVKSKVL